jgi:hypothetical protein
VEVKIGVQDVPREIVLESSLSPAELTALVDAAVTAGTLLTLTDDKGRLVLVPGTRLGYVELGVEAERKVGFGTL